MSTAIATPGNSVLQKWIPANGWNNGYSATVLNSEIFTTRIEPVLQAWQQFIQQGLNAEDERKLSFVNLTAQSSVCLLRFEQLLSPESRRVYGELYIRLKEALSEPMADLQSTRRDRLRHRLSYEWNKTKKERLCDRYERTAKMSVLQTISIMGDFLSPMIVARQKELREERLRYTAPDEFTLQSMWVNLVVMWRGCRN